MSQSDPQQQQQADDLQETAEATPERIPPEPHTEPPKSTTDDSAVGTPDPDAPGTYVDDEESAEIAEPNEPA